MRTTSPDYQIPKNPRAEKSAGDEPAAVPDQLNSATAIRGDSARLREPNLCCYRGGKLCGLVENELIWQGRRCLTYKIRPGKL
jgi:hypothetical protein